jgi:hypothetical protein
MKTILVIVALIYTSGSQPGVRKELTGGTQNYFNESKK